MESSSARKWHITINGESVEVTNEVYHVMMTDTDRYRRLARNEHRCAQVNYQRCSGDCYRCPWHRQGIYIPIDQYSDKASLSLGLADYADPESIVIQNDSWSYVCEIANQITVNGALLLTLRFDEGKTTSEIAEIMMVSRQAVEKRLHRLLEYFRANEKEFF